MLELLDRVFWYGALAGAVLAGALAGPLGWSKLQLLGIAGGLGALVGAWWAWRLFR